MFSLKQLKLLVISLTFALLVPAELLAAVLAGKVQFVVGEVSATSESGDMRQLKKGDWIFSGDTIKTSQEGSAQLIFKDRSRMAVRVNTEFKIESFSFDKNNVAGSKSEVSLVTGALRAVTGLIGSTNKSNVSIKTPITTIGIRGTDHEVIHLTPDFNLDKNFTDVGTYNRVYSGATFMKANSGQVLELNLNDVGFVGGIPGKIINPVKLKVLPSVIEKQLIHKIPMVARKLPAEKPGVSKPVSKSEPAERVNKIGDRRPVVSRSGLATGVTSNRQSVLNPKISTPSIGTSKTLTPSTFVNPTLSTGTFDTSRTALPATTPGTVKTLPATTVLQPAISTSTLTTTKTLTPTVPTTTTTIKTLDSSSTISPTFTSPLIRK